MRKVLKWGGIVVGCLVVALAVAVGAAVPLSNGKFDETYDVKPQMVALPTDAASLAEGERLYKARGCAECHGLDGGGKVVVDDPGLGSIHGSNITRGKGGRVASYTDVDWVRTVRHGVKPDRRSVVMMPADEMVRIGDRELGAILAYVKSLPPVDRESVEPNLKILAHVLNAYGILELATTSKVDHTAPRPPEPEMAETPDFGRYLASIQCVGCHGDGYSGGPLPGAPPSLPVPANITMDQETGLGKWSQAEFKALLRTGKRPDGSDVNPFMPWAVYKNLNDTEINALWAYLKSVPAKKFGGR